MFINHKDRFAGYSVHETLVLLTDEQMRENHQTANPFPTELSGMDIFDAYLQHPSFRLSTYPAATRLWLSPPDNLDYEDLRGNLSGQIFHDIAKWLATSYQPESALLLSENRTLEVFRKLYPRAQVVEFPFGASSLVFPNELSAGGKPQRGISVSDAVEVQAGSNGLFIAATHEYTAISNAEKVRKKIPGFIGKLAEVRRLVTRGDLEIFGDQLECIFITPNNSPLENILGEELKKPRHEGLLSQVKLGFITVDFSSVELARFTDFVIHRYRPATLDELRSKT